MSHSAHRILPALVALAFALPVRADSPPPPIDPTLFSFPGSLRQPPSARSAGLGLADAWIGDEPFGNPAAPIRRHVSVSPTLLRLSRQDLRAANRDYDDQSAFFDGAGASLGLPYLPIWIYAEQPTLRFEDFVYARGPLPDPNGGAGPPAIVHGRDEVREIRTGAALSLGFGSWHVGGAVEWTRREDLYRSLEESGSPEAGFREVSFDGDGTGGALGVRYDSGDSVAGAWTVGAAARYLAALQLTGEALADLLFSDTTYAVSAERESAWEGGVSARYWVNPAFRVLAGLGLRTEAEWKGFGVSSGRAVLWRLAMEYDDREDPWAFRLGIGQDQEDGVPEPRAGVVSVGLGWDLSGIVFDLGAIHRSVEHGSGPRSIDDRVVGTVTVAF